MELIKALRFKHNNRIAFVGAGGKSTAMFLLAREISGPVILTTSTHLSDEQINLTDKHFIIESHKDLNQLKSLEIHGVNLFTGPINEGKAAGLSIDLLALLDENFKKQEVPILIEADGSKKLPIKAPAHHEPPIPGFVDTVVVTVGFSAIGKECSETWVHRPELYSTIAGIKIGSTISKESIVQSLTHKKGGLKNIPAGARKVALLNKVDTPELYNTALEMTGDLLEFFDTVLISSLPYKNLDSVFHSTGPGFVDDKKVISTHESIAGIVLAAGEAKRFGQPKQLLDWKGKPLVWHAVKCALDAGLSPVMIIMGAYRKEIETVFKDPSIELLYNADWKNGQGTSVSYGVRNLPENIGAVIFLLADQPLIPFQLINKIIRSHATSLAPIIAPYADGKLSNPVLFDRNLFPELRSLSGDLGGRSLFSKHPILKVPWEDPLIRFDIDSKQDYDQLLRMDI